MKFGKQLAAHQYRRWAPYYIDYGQLKRLLREMFPGIKERKTPISFSFSNPFRSSSSAQTQMSVQSPLPNSHSQSLLASDQEHKTNGVDLQTKLEEFRVVLQREADKVDEFYHDTERKLTEDFDALSTQIQNADLTDEQQMDAIQSGFVHLYRKLTMLLNFIALNATGFNKIAKKFAKKADFEDSDLSSVLKDRYFHTSTAVPKMMDNTSALYARYFEEGDVAKAKVRLFARMSESDYSRTDMFRLGAKMGLVVALLAWTLVLCLFPEKTAAEISHFGSSVIPIYRSIGLVICVLWFWGANIFLWTKHRVNYVWICEFNPQSRLTHFQVFEEAAGFSVVYLGNALLYLYNFDIGVSRLIYPAALFVYAALKLFVPFEPFSHWKSRQLLINSLSNIVRAPFGRVRFFDIYLADVLTSMPKILVDVFNSMFFLAASMFLPADVAQDKVAEAQFFVVPLICALPLWFRFQQCMNRYYERRKRFPDVANAGKYAVSEAVVVMGSFHPLYNDHGAGWDAFRTFWVFLCIVSSLYAFTWDVMMDWGLFRRPPGGNQLELRKDRLYPTVWVYYGAIASNLFLRFLWTVNIVPFTATEYLEARGRDTLFLPLLYFMELYRRFQWGLFRVEYEHLANVENFRSEEAFVPVLLDKADTTGKEGPTARDYGVVMEIVLMVIIVLVISIALAIV